MDAQTVILVHRLVGYPTAFGVAPLALAAFATPRLHRRFGKAYFFLMLFLYLTGTWLTLTRHPWASWDFARNLTFNFFGFSMVLYAYRAIALFRTPATHRPQRIDWWLASTLTATVAGMFWVACWKDPPMRVFTAVGAWMCYLEWRELLGPDWGRALLFRRHTRYIVASYFYVLTVISVVHLDRQLPVNLKWLWPTPLAIIAIWLLTARSRWDPLPGVSQAVVSKAVVRSIVALSFAYAACLVYLLLHPG